MMAHLARLIYHEDTLFIEWNQSLLSMLWGCWLLAPWLTFGSSKSFALMAELAPEWVWGGLLIGAGSIQCWGLLRHQRNVRRSGVILGFALWVVVASLLIGANWQAASTITYPWVAINYAWTYWRLRLHEL